ncbi:MAG: hypothetical protein M3361_13200 [Candidatus Tectomicrobia bacterium]|nr:hypothetical protein [Candidatus Tectomicrobia bacterium]
MRVQLYKRLADAFRATITDVYDDHVEEVVFIPPFATLVLERSESRHQVLQRLWEIREEYASLRTNLAQLEAERAQV